MDGGCGVKYTNFTLALHNHAIGYGSHMFNASGLVISTQVQPCSRPTPRWLARDGKVFKKKKKFKRNRMAPELVVF